jgi:hypothetical protein
VDFIWTIAEGVAAIFAIIAGVSGAFRLFRHYRASRIFTTPLPIFSNVAKTRDALLSVKNRTLLFDTVLDFSVWNEQTFRIAGETEYRSMLSQPASELNNKSLPLYTEQEGGRLDCFVYLTISVKDANKLKFSHGGTGVIQVLLKGRFDIEVRHYSGPSIEFTLREVDRIAA